jgi:hypothetical protein
MCPFKSLFLHIATLSSPFFECSHRPDDVLGMSCIVPTATARFTHTAHWCAAARSRTVLTGVCQRARDREIAAIVKNHSDRAIWVTTTPVPLNVTSGPSRHNRDVIRFNAAAARVMSELSIPICDVYSAVMRCARRICKLHEHCSLEHTHPVPPFPHSSTTVAATSSPSRGIW